MIKIENIYTVGDGFYLGERILLKWINKSKTITIGQKRYTQAYGTLLKNNKNINVVLEYLKDDDFIDYNSMSKVNLIKRIRLKDSKAKKEYIIRYKKIPKF